MGRKLIKKKAIWLIYNMKSGLLSDSDDSDEGDMPKILEKHAMAARTVKCLGD